MGVATPAATEDFGPFNGRTWLNCAHQGPMPRVAVQEAVETLAWKIDPSNLTQERFHQVPERLKQALGRLIDVPPEEIVLGNSASYGLHLLANGINWRPGDEVLLVKSDFPSNILPWLGLEDRGVVVRYVDTADYLPDPQELASAITSSTRLFCSSWVHSFSGIRANLRSLAEICRDANVVFVVNASQGLGAQPLTVSAMSIDALVCVGFKWLCGPYGTGFCWMTSALLESLRYNQAYWLAEMTADDLARDSIEVRRRGLPNTSRTFDVFGTANFLNFRPWAASIEYLLEQKIDRIAQHNHTLVDKLIAELDPDRYVLVSPRDGMRRSSIVILSHKASDRNRVVHEAMTREGVDIGLRLGKLRFSPHLYNTAADIDRALAVLHSL